MYLDITSRSSTGALLAPRANKPEVRNPILSLPCAARAHEMPAPAREWLIGFLQDLRRDAQERAAKCWRTHKAPLGFYWKVVAVYAGHLVKVLRHTAKPEARQ